MMRNPRFPLALVIAALVAAPAFAGPGSRPDFAIVGVGDLASTDVSGSPAAMVVNGVTISNLSVTTKAKLGMGAGALMNAHFSPRLGAEIGALYVTRKFDSTASFTALGAPSSTVTANTLHYVEIPVALRFWLSPRFSIGVGGYYASGLGSSDFTAASTKKSDYGALGSAQLRLPLGGSTALLLDGRYEYGLANVDTSGYGNQKYRTVQGMAGLCFGMGK